MVYAFTILGIILAVAAFYSESKGMRIWWLVWSLLNFSGAIHAVVTDYEYAYKFRENTGSRYAEPEYRTRNGQ